MTDSGIRFVEAVGYKAFEETARLDLAPLTVVFGPNGSGKSALVRLPMLLAAALRPTADAGPGLPWIARGMHFGSSLLGLRHGGISDRVDLTLGFGDAVISATIGRQPGSPDHLPGLWVERWSLTRGDARCEATWSHKDRGYRSNPTGVASFRGLTPIGTQLDPAYDVSTIAPHVEHLGAQRTLGNTMLVPFESRPVWDVGARGEDTGRVLASLRAFGGEAVLEAISATVLETLAMELRVSEFQAGAAAGVALEGRRGGRTSWQPLAELGTGLAHALPVIVQHETSAFAGGRPPDLLVVEEPEAHLHPTVQAALADVLLKTAQGGRSRCLVETHSETLILRLQRRVAEDPAIRDMISLVFVDDEGALTVPRALSIDPDGVIEGWPDGWFDSALHEAQAIRNARRLRKAP